MSESFEQLLSYWENRISKDLAAFTDPNTLVKVDSSHRTLTCEWLMRGDSFSATFSPSYEAGLIVTFEAQQYGYPSFLASERLGDVMGLAKMSLQATGEKVFVDTTAVCEDIPLEGPATRVLQDVLAQRTDLPSTQIVMVTGEAGSGKTQVLRKLAREQADRYTRGQASFIFLYINAQGRALARLNEAMATELQDLRARLTYNAVPALVRAGLIVPIIDGFDELLGIGGYDDAFSSLSGFVAELDGEGSLVASSRSAYYEQEFVARANSASAIGSQIWTQFSVKVNDWGDEEVSSYLSQIAADRQLSAPDLSKLESIVAAAFSGQNLPLRRKPLFIAKVVELALTGLTVESGTDLLDSMVNVYLQRESTQKLRDRQGVSLLSAKEIGDLLTELAEEMWNLETRELDAKSVREVAEYVLSSKNISTSNLAWVVERMPSIAFLTSGERSLSIAFEHETFFGYFLAHRISTLLAAPVGASNAILGRSILAKDVATHAVRIANHAAPRLATAQILRTLGQTASLPHPRLTQVKENAGGLALELLSSRSESEELKALPFSELVFAGSEFGSLQLIQCSFKNCEFRRANLSRAKFMSCISDASQFYEVMIDPSETRFEMQGLRPDFDIVGINEVGPGGRGIIYDPERINAVLAATGAPVPAALAQVEKFSVDPHVLDVLERFVRAYRKSNPVCTANDFMRNVFEDLSWPKIETLLLKSGVVTSERRVTKGSGDKTFLRRQVNAEEILSGISKSAHVPDSVRDFWQCLEEAFPSETGPK